MDNSSTADIQARAILMLDSNKDNYYLEIASFFFLEAAL